MTKKARQTLIVGGGEWGCGTYRLGLYPLR